LGVAAALALSALASDGKAEEATLSRAASSSALPQRSELAGGSRAEARAAASASLRPTVPPVLRAPIAPLLPPSDTGHPDAGNRGAEALAAAERLLGDGVPLELLQSVIVPAARGVTIAEIQTEGAGAVTLSVRPTKITRGSGLVATAQF
jgi:hypothetical protein